MRRIDELFTAYPFYGSRRMTLQLRTNTTNARARELDPKFAFAYNGRAWAYFKADKAAQGLPDVYWEHLTPRYSVRAWKANFPQR
jgi:hypothetical protein